MTPKEKANELFDKFYLQTEYHINCGCEFLAKDNALICVDEIINTGVNQDYIKQDGYMLSLVEFYTEVKQEINKL